MLISKTVTQIRNGKFRFEKKVKGDERYSLLLYPCVEALVLYVSPGTKANITGNDAHPSVWNVKSDNPLQRNGMSFRNLKGIAFQNTFPPSLDLRY